MQRVHKFKYGSLASGDNLNIYSGEPVAMVENQNLTYTQLRQMVADGKTIYINQIQCWS